jgi:hypothetical protein
MFIVTTNMKKCVLHGIRLLIHGIAMLYVEEYWIQLDVSRYAVPRKEIQVEEMCWINVIIVVGIQQETYVYIHSTCMYCVYTQHMYVLCIYTAHVCTVYIRSTCMYCVYTQHMYVLCIYAAHVCTVYIRSRCMYCVYTRHMYVLCIYAAHVCTVYIRSTCMYNTLGLRLTCFSLKEVVRTGN